MLNDLFIIFSYALLGAGGKYVDQAYDLGVFSKKRALLVSAVCAVLISYLIVSDVASAMIFLSLIIGVAISRKIDNIAFYIGAIIVILLPIVFGGLTEITWVPFGILTVSAILDEVGNDWADKVNNKRLVKAKFKGENRKRNKFAEFFFKYRCSMKVALLSLVLFTTFFTWVYFVAFMLFDVMYTLVGIYSESIKVYTINQGRDVE